MKRAAPHLFTTCSELDKLTPNEKISLTNRLIRAQEKLNHVNNSTDDQLTNLQRTQIYVELWIYTRTILQSLDN